MNSYTTMMTALISLCFVSSVEAEERPYLTTQSPITLFSTNDGEFNQVHLVNDESATEWELKTKDSFTVIQLGPDHPPIIKTV